MTKNGARQNYVNGLGTFQSEENAQGRTSFRFRSTHDYHPATTSTSSL